MNAAVLRLLATLALIGTLIVNALANLLPINGLNTGQVSDLYPSLFTPTGLTFSIWSIIYLLLMGFIVLAWIRRRDSSIARLLPWFIASCVLNMSWIWVWHHLYVGMSVVLMLALLSVLIILFRTIHRQYIVGSAEQVFVALPFTIYLAWICVATIANISAWLVAQGWGGGFLSPEGWTAVMMTIAAVLAFKITFDFRTPAFSVVVFWALLGIYLRWKGTDHALIVIAAVVLMVTLGVTVVYIARNRVRA